MLKKEILAYQENKNLLSDALWNTAVFLIKNLMVAPGLLLKAAALKQMWDPQMRKLQMNKYL